MGKDEDDDPEDIDSQRAEGQQRGRPRQHEQQAEDGEQDGQPEHELEPAHDPGSVVAVRNRWSQDPDGAGPQPGMVGPSELTGEVARGTEVRDGSRDGIVS